MTTPYESWIECTLSELIAAFEIRQIMQGDDPDDRVVDLTHADNRDEMIAEAERLLGHGAPITICEWFALDTLYWLSCVVRCGGKEPTWGMPAFGTPPLESPIPPEDVVALAWQLADPTAPLIELLP